VEFIADNPGYWFLHCHIEPHQLEGMAAVINEVQSRHNPPPSGMMSCKSFTWSVDDFRQKRNNPQLRTTTQPKSAEIEPTRKPPAAGVELTQSPVWENIFLLVALVIAQQIL
jgi:hypothetical protein